MEFIEGTALSGASRFCFGCEQLGGVDWGDVDIEELTSAIQLAGTCGVNFFDTAAIYGLGLSESRLSRTLDRKRFDVTIATKGGLIFERRSKGLRAKVLGNASPDGLVAGVAESLERLRIESLPIFFVHRPDSKTPIESTMNALMSLKQAGKIRNIGLSNFDCDQISAAQQFGDVDVVQVAFSLVSQESRPIVDMCEDQGIPVCAYGVLAQGLLTGKYSAESDFSAEDRRHRLEQFSPEKIEKNMLVVDKLSELAGTLKRTPAQIAIRYALQYSGVSAVVVGIKSRLQLTECIDVFDWNLSPTEIAFLEN